MASRTIRPRPRRASARPSFFATIVNWALTLFVVGFLCVLLYLMWPMVLARLSGAAMPAADPAQPTAQIAPAARPARITTNDPAPAAPDVQQSIEDYNATATAQYRAAIGQGAPAAAPVPNTDTTNDSAPLVIESKPAERQGAGENVPTAEPVMQAESDEQTGSKPVLINPQETHACRHGQVWTDSGCKNPTPIGGQP